MTPHWRWSAQNNCWSVWLGVSQHYWIAPERDVTMSFLTDIKRMTLIAVPKQIRSVRQ